MDNLLILSQYYNQYKDNQLMCSQQNVQNRRKTLLITMLIMIIQISVTIESSHQIKAREIINYQMSFSQDSNVTLVFTSCGSATDLRDGILSFLYYNTYPLRSIIIVDRCLTPEGELRNTLPFKSNQNKKWFQIMSIQGNQIQALQRAFELVRTKYVMNYANKWITTDGYGFIEQAIDAIQYGEKHNMKISQVTTLFLQWKNYRSLARYMKTDKGTQFYEIRSFKPTLRYYFTLNPSLINFKAVFRDVIGGDANNFAGQHRCEGKNIRDCFQLQLGKKLNENGYVQAFVDDGAKQPNVYSLLKS